MYACRRGIKLGPVMAVVGTIGTDISDEKRRKKGKRRGNTEMDDENRQL